MDNVTVVDHPLVRHKLSLMRRKETDPARFRLLLREISLLLGYEVTRDLATETRKIQTPLSETHAPFLTGKKLVLISILRAGNGLLEGMLTSSLRPLLGMWGSTAMRRRWQQWNTISRCQRTSRTAR